MIAKNDRCYCTSPVCDVRGTCGRHISHYEFEGIHTFMAGYDAKCSSYWKLAINETGGIRNGI